MNSAAGRSRARLTTKKCGGIGKIFRPQKVIGVDKNNNISTGLVQRPMSSER